MTIAIFADDAKRASTSRTSRHRRQSVVASLAVFLAVGFVTVLVRPAWPRFIHRVTFDRFESVERDETAVPEISRGSGNFVESLGSRQRLVAGDGGQRSTHVSPDSHGRLFSENQSLSSPNKAYTVRLQVDGDLVLLKNNQDTGEEFRVWSTSTGDGRGSGQHHVLLKPATKGSILSVVSSDSSSDNMMWHSDMEPACFDRTLSGDGSIASPPPRLALSDSGQLTLLSTCHLYTPPSLTASAHSASLAIIVAGLYRTLNETCDSHMSFLASTPSFARVDIFAYILLDSAPGGGDDDATSSSVPSPADAEARIRSCYGSRLRSLTVLPRKEVEEEYPGGPAQMLRPCKRRVQRLNNQLKTLREAGKAYWEWSVREGFVHDTMLRIRPDTLFEGNQGDMPPAFRSDALGGGSRGIVLVHPRDEHPFWCPRSTGRVGIGPSDQVAYGPPALMSQYLNMHDDFARIISLASNPDRPAHRDFSGCEVVPSGPRPEDCARPAPCAVECMVAWYLESKGVDFEIEWKWNQTVLRTKNPETVAAGV